MDLHTVTRVLPARRRSDLAALSSGSVPLAGGTWLFSEPQPQIHGLVDLTTLGWPSIDITDTELILGATCTVAELAGRSWPETWVGAELIGHCCEAYLASFKIWNQATVGGNLALSFPAGPMISLATALDATCTIWRADGSDEFLPVLDLVTGPGENLLRPGDVIRDLRFSAAKLSQPSAFRKLALSALGRSAAVVIGRRIGAGGVICITAATRRPVRLAFGQWPEADSLRQTVEELPSTIWFADVHGPADWRAAISAELAEQVRLELG